MSTPPFIAVAAPGHSLPAKGPRSRLARFRAVAAPLMGNVLEWYDFAVYAFIAAYIAKNFFPTSAPATALLSSFAVFGVGFLARPLGSLVIGRIGDVRGRRSALLLTMYLMTAGTLLLAILPTYGTAGVIAPALLVVARLLQGFSAGGEWGGSVSYIVEWSPERRRGLFGSLHVFGVIGGFLLGSGVAALVNSVLSAQEMADWGWRVPFVIGCLIGPVALWMRRAVAETPAFEKAVAERVAPIPMLEDKEGCKLAIKAGGVSVLSNISFYVMLLYMPTWVTTNLKLSMADALWANTVGLVCVFVLTPCFGLLSDLIGRKKVLLFSCAAVLLVAYPAFGHLLALESATLKDVVLVQCIFAIILASIYGVQPTTIVEMFPTRNRTTWMSIGYGLTASVFGGFAPFIAVWLIQTFQNPIAPVYYLIFGAILSALFTFAIRETAFETLK